MYFHPSAKPHVYTIPKLIHWIMMENISTQQKQNKKKERKKEKAQ